MIVSRLPPSRFLGSVAASIHTPVFKCFVNTARPLFISRQLETMIFEGDLGDQDGFSRFARFFYRPEFSPASI